jgi:hypothetical protein
MFIEYRQLHQLHSSFCVVMSTMHSIFIYNNPSRFQYMNPIHYTLLYFHYIYNPITTLLTIAIIIQSVCHFIDDTRRFDMDKLHYMTCSSTIDGHNLS